MIYIIQLVIITVVLKDLAAVVGELVLTVVDSVSNRFGKIALYLLSYLLNCPKCFSFWFCLLLGADLFTSALVALSISLILTITDKYLNTTTLL